MSAETETSRRLPFEISTGTLLLLIGLVPLALFFGLLWFVPIVYTLWSSLFTDPTGAGVFVGFGNYIDILTSAAFWAYLLNSVVFAVGTTVLSLLVGLAFALAVNQKIVGKGGLRTLMIFPYLLPTVVVVYLWTFLLDQNLGIVNQLLVNSGLVADPIAFFSDPTLAMPSVIVTSVWKWGSFAFFIVLANVQAIPETYYERARVEGASMYQQFRDITLPHLRSAILIIVLVRGIWMFNKFDIIWLTTNGGPVGKTTTLPIRIYDLAIRLARIGDGSALAGIMFGLLLVVALVYFVVLDPTAEVRE